MSDSGQAIRFSFGYWDAVGMWHHNPILKMTADEQWAHNVKHGYIEVPK